MNIAQTHASNIFIVHVHDLIDVIGMSYEMDTSKCIIPNQHIFGQSEDVFIVSSEPTAWMVL